MVETWPACAAGLLVLTGLAAVSRRLSHSWLSPAPFFAALWVVVAGVPLLGAPDEPVWPPAVWLLVLFVAVFCAAAVLTERRALVGEQGPAGEARSAAGRLGPIVLAASILGAGAVVALMLGQEHPIADLLDADAWLQVSARYAIGRYEQDVDEPLAARLLSIGFYFGAATGGWLWVSSRRIRDRLIAVLPLLVALAHATLTTARAVLLFALSMWLASAFAARVVDRRPFVRIRPKAVSAALLASAALIAVSTGLQLARGGAGDLTTPQEALSHLGTWLFGHLPGFGIWLRERSDGAAPLELGRRTFGGAFQVLGLADRERGVYADFVRLASGRETNIYTAFRGLIQDFGLAGAIAATALSGVGSALAYARALRGRPGSGAALALAYSFLLWTPIVSFFSYNTLLVAFALAAPALRIAARRERTSHAHPALVRALPV
jgi:hypothetical protein